MTDHEQAVAASTRGWARVVRPDDPDGAEGLVCPVTSLPLRPVPLSEARELVAGGRELSTRRGRPAPVGATPVTLVRSDARCAYPVVDGIPVLLAPERLIHPDGEVTVDLTAPRYAEAYAEMDSYNEVATREGEALGAARLPEEIARVAALPESRRQVELPHPGEVWLDAAYEAAAQWDAYQHLPGPPVAAAQ